MGKEERDAYAKAKSDEIRMSLETYLKIASTSFVQSDSDMLALETALAKGDSLVIKDTSHRINGVYLNLRIDNVSKYAQEIEQLVNDDGSLDAIKDNFKKLQEEYEKIKAVLQ
ncbi:MAG: Hpt domain-containing protein [Candidatus Omnitrophica bacterium]|nr:Hpt domain-containing protein [Candidatus Omnitrophota bacterium]MBU1996893.1 Hpt domain-containing protein [Candidatus Omnitrophota bacterium]MBU4332941.1 Hpt domain-containing protein [Candidatus Omnitrophota bacterium]